MKNIFFIICFSIMLSPALATDYTPSNKTTPAVNITPEMHQNMIKFQRWYNSPEVRQKRLNGQQAWQAYIKANPQAVGAGQNVMKASQEYVKKHNITNVKKNSNNAFKNYMEQRRELQKKQGKNQK